MKKIKLVKILKHNNEMLRLYKSTHKINEFQDNTQKIRDLIHENITIYSELRQIRKQVLRSEKKYVYEEIIYFNHLPFGKRGVSMKNITSAMIQREEDLVNGF